MNQFSLTIPEILALIGIVQCTFLIVHIFFGASGFKYLFIPVLFFCALGAGFTSDFAQDRLSGNDMGFFYLQWWIWFSTPPISALLIKQLVHFNGAISWRACYPILLIPISFAIASVISNKIIGCVNLLSCMEMQGLLYIAGLIAGAVSLLIIFNTERLYDIRKQKFGRERYWLTMAIILLNVGFLFTVFMVLVERINVDQFMLMRNVLGLGFVYLVSTSILRIYPKPQASTPSNLSEQDLNKTEEALAKKISSLLSLEKIYQEPTYSRADLARECDVSEMALSRVINIYFKKSFPQLMNDHRIDDAKQLLLETDAPLNIIAEEVGFNSLSSFNRVFKNITGQAPGQFRKIE